jgi:TonB-dependent receptor
MNNGPLPFANVQIKGTSKGTTTDIDGLYEISTVEPGTYTIVISFIGYETLEVPNIKVEAGKVTELNTGIGAGSVSLDEVVVTTTVRRDSQVALLLEQKRAIEIKESIGAQQLSKLGVSDVATATTKISGVTSSEASGDLFVRGLGDRYLHTTLNGMPIPSDDVERKNIDLSLFPTSIIQNVGISKTYSTDQSADQSSGNIDVSSRELVGDSELSLGVKGGVNTNVTKSGVFDNFRATANKGDVVLGVYTESGASEGSIIGQSWDTEKVNAPVDYQYTLTAGKRIGEKLKVLFTGYQSSKHNYREGLFRQYDSNFIDDSITDATTYSKTINTTGLLDVNYSLNTKHKLKFNSLFINKLNDAVFEGGRNGEASIFEETAPAEGLSQFIRDQNIIQTNLWVNQLFGTHQLTENNTLDWGVGYNLVNADQPNRIRNELNVDMQDSFVQLGRTGGFQQRKSKQEIDDNEINAIIKDAIYFSREEGNTQSLSFGASYRNKKRDFYSKFYGVYERVKNVVHPTSVDEMSSIFTYDNFERGHLIYNELQADTYEGELESIAGFANFNIEVDNLNVNLGVRYQNDKLNVAYNVGNIPGRLGESYNLYDNFYPSLNLKYSLGEKHSLRFATSRTITLPEFKEIAPFEYVSPTGQVTRGNPDIMASTNYNYDLKWEFFPSRTQLISLTGFYKQINDPINKVLDRGSAGVFSYFNSAERANVYGLEFETRLNLIKPEEGQGYGLDLNLNATRMWHNQDLKEIYNEDGNFVRTFRYKGITETKLQGASDWIFNGSLNFSTNSENPFDVALIASYASDKVYALGAPTIQTQSETYYNDAIIEQGFLLLDAVISKQFNKHWGLRLTGQNLLNPEIKRTQKIRPSTTGIETEEVISSYSNGAVLSLGINYTF